ncbi:MAG: 30S ribosomal protein S20 [Rickettsiales bacterium]|nr:30S ribosomal protein S20 [Rickettsiales bacterium]
MANHKSTKKRVRRDRTRTMINRKALSRIRTFIKKVESDIDNNDVEAAKKAFILAQPEIHKGVTKGILKKNTASRKISRLAAKIKAAA